MNFKVILDILLIVIWAINLKICVFENNTSHLKTIAILSSLSAMLLSMSILVSDI
ncbi:hypothetical protein [Clostridium botulinum]|uniref:hypothetical protein n=1 Tax=Clostridium botulinum TaxID=1491 RepID=UPI0019682750|nr:hypothetical protein [Clostridium botulinum]MBY6838648.1 hypothetical protein [Clostridium botulinum]